MEKLMVFLDYANVNRSFEQYGEPLDAAHLLNYLSNGRFLVEAFAYVPIDPRNPHQRDGDIENLWKDGYLVTSKVGAIAGDSYKCDFDVEITLDLMRVAEQVKPDIIVLVSGDKDFLPVMLELRKRGIRMEIAAFRDLNAAREMVLKASGFVDLAVYLSEVDPLVAASKENAILAPEEDAHYPENSLSDAVRAAVAADDEFADEDNNPLEADAEPVAAAREETRDPTPTANSAISPRRAAQNTPPAR